MEINIENIDTICVALDIAIITIAYPIIIDKISTIGKQYSSDYLSEVFEKEFPQREIKILGGNVSFFILSIYLTLISFIPQVFQVPPPENLSNFWIITNSADLFLIITTLILLLTFFSWLRLILTYNHKSSKLLSYLIIKFNQSNENDQNYLLKSINDLGYYAIRQQDVHIQKTLLNFYHEQFTKYQKASDENKPVEYHSDLYQFNFDVTTEIVNSSKNKLRALEHRAVSGVWLMGEGMNSAPISEKTYQWLWRNLNIISENPDLIKMYWSRAHQIYDHHLPYISGTNYDFESQKFENQDEIGQRIKERERFQEFNYVFGALLLFKKNYKGLDFILNHSSSLPPRYVLLPQNMSNIFEWLQHFSEHNYEFDDRIEFKYPFFDLDDYWGNNIRNFIFQYLGILFIRQFTLSTSFTYDNFIGQPKLPEQNVVLNEWLRNIHIFEMKFQKLLENEQLIKELGFEKVIEKEKNENILSKFLIELKERINSTIIGNDQNIKLLENKINEFENETTKLLNKALEDYNKINNSQDLTLLKNVTKFGVNGLKTLFPKTPFGNEDTHLNELLMFTKQVISQQLKYFIPNTFLVAKTKRYLFKLEDVPKVLKKMQLNDSHIIVVINPSYNISDNFKPYENLITEIPSSNKQIQNCFFVLKKEDLPTIKNIELDKKVIEEENLKHLKNNFYSSIFDLNLEENKNVLEKWLEKESESDLKKQVELTIAFQTLITWKESRNVIQLNIYSSYSEQGILNSLEEIEPIG